jgi:hypothetical protein
MTVALFPRWKRKCGPMCCDATANSFVAKVRGKVFAHFQAVAVKHHSSMWNWLFGLPGRILCEQSILCQIKMMNMLLSLLFSCLFFRSRWILTFHVGSCIFSPNSCLIIARVSITLFRDFIHKILCCLFVKSFAKSHQARYTTPNKMT